jgi:acetyltransferase
LVDEFWVSTSHVKTDLAHDVLRTQRQPLKAIFTPKTIAVIGATERAGSVGRTIFANLLSNKFGGAAYPVNPTRPDALFSGRGIAAVG